MVGFNQFTLSIISVKRNDELDSKKGRSGRRRRIFEIFVVEGASIERYVKLYNCIIYNL